MLIEEKCRAKGLYWTNMLSTADAPRRREVASFLVYEINPQWRLHRLRGLPAARPKSSPQGYWRPHLPGFMLTPVKGTMGGDLGHGRAYPIRGFSGA